MSPFFLSFMHHEQIFYNLVADDWRAGNENLIDEVYATVISSSP